MRQVGQVEKIVLNIFSNNENSIESCKNNGFHEESRALKERVLPDGRYVDLINFVLYL